VTPKVLKGLAAGVAGVAAMTVHQEIRKRLASRDAQAEPGDPNADGSGQPNPWESAPAPAQVGKRLIEGVLGWRVPSQAIPALTQVMHWSYGTLWGGVYAVGRDLTGRRAQLPGPVFGLGVWAASYVQLVPLGIYKPPWKYPLGSLADEIGFHLTYGTTVALTYALLDDGVGNHRAHDPAR
jgi:hypothetical protein